MHSYYISRKRHKTRGTNVIYCWLWTITCSKSKIETVEKGVKYVQKLTIKTPERRHWRVSGVLIVYFDHTFSYFLLVFVLLTLNKQMLVGASHASR